MGRYSDYHPTPATRDYMTKIPGFMDQVGTDIDELAAGKADANHSHGTGGEVVSIGAPDARPAVTDGFIHSEPGASADETALVILNADGSERARAIMNTDIQSIIPKGFISGLYPVYRDTSSIDVAPGVVTIGGQVYELPSAVTLSPTLTGSSWHFIYVKAAPASPTLTASDFTVSTTAPTRSADGWYDTDGNRCVGFFWTTSAPAIADFECSGGWFHFTSTCPAIINSSSPPTSLTTAKANAPVNPATIEVTVHGQDNGNQNTTIHIHSGSTTTLNNPLHRIMQSSGGATWSMISGSMVVTTDASGNISYCAYNGGVTAIDALYIYLQGVQLPIGMGG